MDYDGRFIMQKTVDWSLLNDGMTIPVSACALLKAWDESQNNDSTNIIVISPNYHRIMQKDYPTLQNTIGNRVKLGKTISALGFEHKEHSHVAYYKVVPLRAA